MIKSLRFISLSLAMILLASVCLFNVKTERAEANFTNFITRNGDKLMDGTSEYRFIGTNQPFLERAWQDPLEIEDAIRAASKSGIDVIRLYPFEVKMSSDPAGTYRHVMGPNDYNESAFKLFDKILQLANQYDIRLIVPFVDKYDYIGGYADWAVFRGKTSGEFWTDPTVKQDFKNFINYVVNRTNTYTGVQYKNDKAILGWQLGNELTSTDSWTSEMAAYFKSLDSNHLVGDGGYVRAQGIRDNALNDSNIDFIDPHIYGYHNYPDIVAKLNEWRDQTKTKKPLIIGEFGDFSLTEMDQLLSTVQSNGTTGAMLWGTMHHHKMGGWYWQPIGTWGVYMRYPGFASGDWANESGIIDLVRSYAYSFKGSTVPAWPTPDTPIMFPADSVHTLSWMGVSGASAYNVERSTSASGPWTLVGNGVTDDITAPRHHTFTIPIFDDSSATVGTSYYYRVKAKNLSGVYSLYSNVIGPVTAQNVIIVDNGTSNYTETGTWGGSTLSSSYGGSSRYSSNSGSTATWKPNITAAGYYNVYVRYPYHQGSAINAEYTVYHNGITNTLSNVDQTTIANGQWRLIDTAYFAGDPTEYVKLSVMSNGVNSRADAIMLEPKNFGDSFQNNSSGHWTTLSGSWTVGDDVTKVLKQSSTGIAETRGGSIYSNVAVTAAVKAYNKTSVGAASGVVARASYDFSSLYSLRIHYDLNKVQLHKKVSGVWIEIGNADIAATPGTWNLLRLELKGSSLKGYVNGVQKISVSDSSLTSGYIGLRTYDQTAVFDNIMVSPN